MANFFHMKGRTMGAPSNAPIALAAPTLTSAQVEEMSAAAFAASGSDPNVDPRELMNAQLVNEQKARVLCKSGYTRSASAATLLANAQRRDYNHRRRFGLSDSIKAATQQTRPPEMICGYTTELLKRKRVSDVTFNRVKERFGGKGVVDLTGLAGYYTLLAMQLNAAQYKISDNAVGLKRLPE
jgi:hypothetical protein